MGEAICRFFSRSCLNPIFPGGVWHIRTDLTSPDDFWKVDLPRSTKLRSDLFFHTKNSSGEYEICDKVEEYPEESFASPKLSSLSNSFLSSSHLKPNKQKNRYFIFNTWKEEVVEELSKLLLESKGKVWHEKWWGTIRSGLRENEMHKELRIGKGDKWHLETVVRVRDSSSKPPGVDKTMLRRLVKMHGNRPTLFIIDHTTEKPNLGLSGFLKEDIITQIVENLEDVMEVST